MTQPMPQPCRLMIRNAVILTMDEDDAVIGGGAVAIGKDRILAVGPQEEIAATYDAAEVIDAGGALLLPGLVNTHNHSPLMAVRGMIEDLGFAPAYTPGIPQTASVSDEEMLALARLGQYEMLRAGATSVVDFYRRPAVLAQAAEEIGLRAIIGGRIMDADPQALAEGRWAYDRALGEKLLAENLEAIERFDGAAGGRIRCGLAPHAADTCSLGLLRLVAAEAARRGGPVHTHLAQSRKEIDCVRARDGLRPVEVFAEAGLLDSRLIAAHCVFLDDDSIRLAGQAGMVVAHAPIGNVTSGMVAPILALEEAGATITLAGDTMTADLFESMRMASALARIQGAQFQPDARRLLRWATTNGAKAMGLAGEIGAVAPGRKADLILLDPRQPCLAPVIDGHGIVVRSASALAVDTVLIDGEIRLRHGRPVGFDGDAIVAEGQKVAERMWAASGRKPVTRGA
ncbi:amidohydrolase family protein [Telmatospirillum sp. J64-1]|uniref:amidohydrolase family protein n=1 Tax=Telmatospirillum sp. J64-1 TaxID=2502183 RepID=UPI00115CD7B2|nr:amidohydrolase family protein [Telmatospirillum sp. J64-1]